MYKQSNSSKQSVLVIREIILAIILCSLATACQAGLLQTQSNPVNFGGLYWGNPTNWNTLGIPKYQLDTPSDGTHNRDINFISIAHDAYYFYVRINYIQAPPFGGEHNLWLDSDLNPSTGARNWSGNGSIGSEYLITGAALIKDPSAWDFQAWLNWDQNPGTAGDLPRDVIFSINRSSQLPGVTAFNFTSQLYNNADSTTGDWYPDSADSQTGDFFRYTTGEAPAAPPTASSDAYQKIVVSHNPLAYYRLNEITPVSQDVATNSGAFGTNGNGTYTIGSTHPVPGAIVGDGDTAAHFSAVDTNSIDGAVPVLVPWPEQPLIRELWDNVGIGVLDNKASGTSSIGLDNSTTWHVNLGRIIKVAQDFDITTPPGLPYNRGQKGGLWADDSDIGGLGHVWDTRAWATRQLAAAAQINFGANGEYWITVRINNGGDTAMGVGFANGGDGSAQFVGVGAMWNSAGGGSANNALYVSDGSLGSDSPYTIRANSSADAINGRGLIVAHLITSNTGNDTFEAAVYQPGDNIPSDSTGFVPQVSYNFSSTMTATHLLVWLNGDTSPSPYGGELDAIRVATSYASMFQGALNTKGSFAVEAWLRPTIEGAGNAQSPLFNANLAESMGWDFYQRPSGTGWNFRMFDGSGGSVFDITGGPYTVGQWCHLVAVYDASAPSATLYFNGVQAATSSSPSGTFVPNPSSPLSIAGYSDASQNPFVGDVDEVAVYTNALSAAQVLAHYLNGTNPARSQSYSSLIQSHGAVEYLRFDEPARNVAANSGTLGPAADGVYNASAANGRSGPRSPGFEASNAAASFDGAFSYIELRNLPALNFTGQITLEAWVQPSVAPAYGFGDILAHGYDEDFNEVVLRVQGSPGGTYQYNISTYSPGGGQGVSANVPAADLLSGAWVHLVGTYDGANWNLYRNGTLLASAPDTSGLGSLMVLKGNWAIGARGRWAHMDVLSPGLDRQFEGKIDEVAIYNTALSPSQVLAHYTIGANGLQLSINRSNSNVIVTWPAGTLLEATNVAGPYTNVSGATSPYAAPSSGAAKFYRARL